MTFEVHFKLRVWSVQHLLQPAVDIGACILASRAPVPAKDEDLRQSGRSLARFLWCIPGLRHFSSGKSARRMLRQPQELSPSEHSSSPGPLGEGLPGLLGPPVSHLRVSDSQSFRGLRIKRHTKGLTGQVQLKTSRLSTYRIGSHPCACSPSVKYHPISEQQQQSFIRVQL